MILKTFDEMLKEYALKSEKVGEEVRAENSILLSGLGLCEVFIMPVVWVENKNTDSVLRFVPFDSEESWYCLRSAFTEKMS